ncbi:LysR substrate-binding domain-containing protein [Streptomyces sp. NPDC047081]|uniref:LysR substrate-binding domain-containing protein n=1 Tax=Streptomyces sp. NPDC047081 TaxID=3154706 RepID=UPI0033C2206C
MTIIELQRETFSVATNGPGSVARPSFESAELNGLPWILPPASSHYGRAISLGLRRRGIESRVVHEVTDTAASLHLAAAGLGATVITPLMRRLSPGLDLCVRPMADPMTRDVVLVVPGGDRPVPVNAFVETARRITTALA